MSTPEEQTPKELLQNFVSDPAHDGSYQLNIDGEELSKLWSAIDRQELDLSAANAELARAKEVETGHMRLIQRQSESMTALKAELSARIEMHEDSIKAASEAIGEIDEERMRLRAELATAKEEGARDYADMRRLQGELIKTTHELNARNAENAELLKDKERLDWLEKRAVPWADHEGLIKGGAMRSIEFDYFAEESLRQGLDAARAQGKAAP